MKIILNVCFLFLFMGKFLQAQQAKDYAVELTAVVTTSVAKVELNWPLDTVGNGYKIYRKINEGDNWGNSIATLPANATSFIDNAVVIGNGYEYYVQRTYSVSNRLAHGYIYVGVQKKMEPQKGKLLLLIDANYAIPLATQIEELILDLTKDGWIVVSQIIERNATAKQVKNIIVQVSIESAEKQPLKALYLLGHIPVPYSGGFKAEQGFIFPPDGHNDHGGAWSTDMYYASLNESIWTDNIVNDTTPSRTENKNIEGDGKFDLMYIGDDKVTIQVGRVDLFNMPSFNKSDTDLVKQYLQKAHAYKTAQTPVIRRGLIDDTWGVMGGEAFAASAYRSFSTMFGNNITTTDYLTSTKQGNYLFTFGGGAGSYTSASGIANTSQFTNDSINQIFTMLFGSYFGDWDSQNNFLRAPLASKNGGLASLWSGRPHWHFHHMALGKNIGFSTLLTQNNFFDNAQTPSGYVHNYAPTFISINLMGDPSLRLHMPTPLTSITIIATPDSLTNTITWQPIDGAVGYWISKTKNISEGFMASVEVASTASSWMDVNPYFGKTFYMVRPIFLEQTPSGTYYNLGLGAIDSGYSKNTVGIAPQKSEISTQAFIYPNPTSGNVTIAFSQSAEATINVYDIQGKLKLSINGFQSLQTLNLSELGKGHFVVNIKTDTFSIVKKVIVH